VYDAVEPLVIWRSFYHLLENDETTLMSWSLRNLSQKDDEVMTLHAPAMLDYVLTVADVSFRPCIH